MQSENTKKVEAEPLPKLEVDVVVSGGGPGGLLSAYNAAKLGKRVAVINNREMLYSREQRVFLDDVSKNLLLDKLGLNWKDWNHLAKLSEADRKFVLEMNRSTTVAVKDVENFLMRRLKDLNKENRELNKEKKEGKDSVVFIANKQINSLDLHNGTLLAQEAVKEPDMPNPDKDQSIKFNHLIAADGANHGAVNAYNKNAKEPIHYKSVPGPKHQFHAGFYFRISSNSDKIIKLPKEQFVETETKINGSSYPVTKAKSLSYPLMSGISFDNQSYIDGKGKTVKCTFGGEIPVEISKILNDPKIDIKDKQKAMIEHIKVVIPDFFQQHELKNDDIKFEMVESHVPEKVAKLNAEEEIQKDPLKKDEQKLDLLEKDVQRAKQKDKMKLQAFKLELVQADKAVVKEGDNYFVLVGDVFRRPNYQYGHGLNHSIRHADATAKLLNGEMTPKEYNEFCKSLAREINIATKIINQLRSVGRKILINAAHKRTEATRKNFSEYNLDPTFEHKLAILQFLGELDNFKKPSQIVHESISEHLKTSTKKLATNVDKMKSKIADAVKQQMENLSPPSKDKTPVPLEKDEVDPIVIQLDSLKTLNSLIDDTLTVLASYKVHGGKVNSQKIQMVKELATLLNEICKNPLENPDELSKKLVSKLEDVIQNTKTSEKKHAFFNLKGAYRTKHSHFLNTIRDVLKKYPELRSTANLPGYEKAAPQQHPNKVQSAAPQPELSHRRASTKLRN